MILMACGTRAAAGTRSAHSVVNLRQSVMQSSNASPKAGSHLADGRSRAGRGGGDDLLCPQPGLASIHRLNRTGEGG
jgi:hypothetical protein